jgi:hypothetical protein
MSTSAACPAAHTAELEGVPRIGFYDGGERCPEDIPFPSAMRSCLDFLDEGLGYRTIHEHGRTWRLDLTYTWMAAVSGAAFRLVWQPGWRQDNPDFRLIFPDPLEPYRRAFACAGREFHYLGPEQRGGFRDAILDSIGLRRCPVIALGVVGPPEACIVTGYEEGGDVLHGWSYFAPGGRFVQCDWLPATEAVLVFGDTVPRPPWGEICRQAIDAAVRMKRGYPEWAEALTHDESFPAQDLPVLMQRLEVHDDAVAFVAEGRWYAANFLREAAEHLPVAAEYLEAAASAYRAEHDLMWGAWKLVGGPGRTAAQAECLANPAVRRDLIAIIESARLEDERANANLRAVLQL